MVWWTVLPSACSNPKRHRLRAETEMLHVSPATGVLLTNAGTRGNTERLKSRSEDSTCTEAFAWGRRKAGGEQCCERVRVPCRHYAPVTAVQFVRLCAAGWQCLAAPHRFRWFQLSGGGPFRRLQCDARKKTLAAFTLRTPRSLTSSASTPSTMATIMVRLHSSA